MKKQDKKQENFCSAEVRQYREKIVEMVNRIDDKKFLRRIYIIISDNTKERPD